MHGYIGPFSTTTTFSFFFRSAYRLVMDYDNDRDRLEHGFDAGQIVDGTVVLDPVTQRFVLVDEDGKGFDPQVVLQSLQGKQIRLTIVSFEAMETIESMLRSSQQESDENTN